MSIDGGGDRHANIVDNVDAALAHLRVKDASIARVALPRCARVRFFSSAMPPIRDYRMIRLLLNMRIEVSLTNFMILH